MRLRGKLFVSLVLLLPALPILSGEVTPPLAPTPDPTAELKQQNDALRARLTELTKALDALHAQVPKNVTVTNRAVRDDSVTFKFETDTVGRLRVHLKRGANEDQTKETPYGTTHYAAFYKLSPTQDYAIEVGALDASGTETALPSNFPSFRFKTAKYEDAPVISDWSFSHNLTESGVTTTVKYRINENAMVVIDCRARESGTSSRYKLVEQQGSIQVDDLGNPSAPMLGAGEQTVHFTLKPDTEYEFAATAMNEMSRYSMAGENGLPTTTTPKAAGDLHFTDEGVQLAFNTLETTVSWRATTAADEGKLEVIGTSKGAGAGSFILDHLKPEGGTTFRTTIPYKKLKEIFAGDKDPVIRVSMRDKLGREQTVIISVSFALPTTEQVKAAVGKTITQDEGKEIQKVVDAAKNNGGGKVTFLSVASAALPWLAKLLIP